MRRRRGRRKTQKMRMRKVVEGKKGKRRKVEKKGRG